MKKIQIVKAYKKMKAKDVVSVEDSYADKLVKDGIAKPVEEK